MEPDGRTYLLPHPTWVRIVLTLAGAFVLVVAPMGLWRGVWPLNVTTPFFAALLFGSMAVGAAFVSGGLLAPSVRLRFGPGRIEVDRSYPWGSSGQVIRSDEIEEFAVEEQTTSDGPNEWYAVLRLRGRPPIRSRPLGTRAAAEGQLGEFRTALQTDDDA